MVIRNNCIRFANIWNNKNFHKLKMDYGLLTWYGNALNFVILIYLVLATLNTSCFNSLQLLITCFGLMVSILIQLRGLLE